MLGSITTYYQSKPSKVKQPKPSSSKQQPKKPRESKKGADFFAKLSDNELLLPVLELLSVQDVVRLARVSNFLSTQCRDQKLWKSFCERDLKDFKKKPNNNNNNNKDNKTGGQRNNKRFIKIYIEEYLKSKGKKKLNRSKLHNNNNSNYKYLLLPRFLNFYFLFFISSFLLQYLYFTAIPNTYYISIML